MYAKKTLFVAFILLAKTFTLVASKKPRVIQYIKELKSWHTTCKMLHPRCTMLQSCAMILKQRQLPLEENTSKCVDEYPLGCYVDFLEQEWEKICNTHLVCEEYEVCAFLLDKLDHIYAKENNEDTLIHPDASQSILWPSLNDLKMVANELEKWHDIFREIKQQCTFLGTSNLILTHQLKMNKTYNQTDHLQIRCYEILRNVRTTLNNTTNKQTLSEACAYCVTFPSPATASLHFPGCLQQFDPIEVLKENIIVNYLKDIDFPVPYLEENQEDTHPAYIYNDSGVEIAQKYKLYIFAIPYFEKAIKMNASYADPWNNLAVCHSRLNDLDQAINALLQCLKINPYFPEGYNNLASFYLTKKEYDKVKTYLKKALQLRPHYGKAYFNMGRMYNEQNQNDKALKCFKKACTIADLNNEFGYKTYAQAAFAQKKYSDAIWAYYKTLEYAPYDTETMFSLANTYYLAKQFDEAIKTYKKILTLNPKDTRVWYNLGETYLNQERFQNALDCFNRVKPQWEQYPQVCNRLATCYEKMGDIPASLKELQTLAMSLQIPNDMQILAKNRIRQLEQHIEQIKQDYEVWKKRDQSWGKIRSVSGKITVLSFLGTLIGLMIRDHYYYLYDERDKGEVLTLLSFPFLIFSTPTFCTSFFLKIFSNHTVQKLKRKLESLGYHVEEDKLIEIKNSITSQDN
jgi:tetratricopeptide (TPR) repeat protein